MCIRDRSSDINKMNSSINVKFDVQNSKFDEQKNSFDELKTHMNEINKRFENTNEIIRTSLNKLEQSIERMGVGVMNTNKSNTNENYNDVCKNVVLDKELTNDDDDIENGNIIEKVLSESDMLKINNESTDEVAECNNEMLMCVYELEREWKDNIVVEWGQRVNSVSYTHLDVYKRQVIR